MMEIWLKIKIATDSQGSRSANAQTGPFPPASSRLDGCCSQSWSARQPQASRKTCERQQGLASWALRWVPWDLKSLQFRHWYLLWFYIRFFTSICLVGFVGVFYYSLPYHIWAINHREFNSSPLTVLQPLSYARPLSWLVNLAAWRGN